MAFGAERKIQKGKNTERKNDMKHANAMTRTIIGIGTLGLALALNPAPLGAAESKPATEHTRRANAAWYGVLDFADERERDNALRGLLDATPSLDIRDADGRMIWSVARYQYMNEVKEVPDTVNPSLWRNTLHNTYAGLFEVCDGIYQVRGYDMANMTFIRTDHGWVVFDVLMCRETAAAALALMEKRFGKLDVKAVLYSHSHVDHYGGVTAILSKEDVADASLPLAEQLASGKTPVIAPRGFLEHAISENVYVGVAMSRRGQYQYGPFLEAGPFGAMGVGIGLGQARGSVTLIAPTYEVPSNETITIDGLEIRFQLTPGTEAPAEMNAWFPRYRALWMAENCTGTLHNLYPLRGAEVRDAMAWARYILEAEALFGDGTDVVFQSHNWPHWGTENVREYLRDTAAVYRFIHDQTLHYVNLGYTPAEISERIRLPERLNRVWYTRQYYGTLSHNVKAVYQKYMGWYDANPVNLNPLTPERTARKWAEYLGDVKAVLQRARADFEAGEYQWAAQITKELVYADPTNQEARELCADALEQLAYQAESGTWRNCYLMGALELRKGNQSGDRFSSGTQGMMGEMTVEMALDYLAIRTDALAAQEDDVRLNLNVTDTGETFYVERREGVLLTYKGVAREDVELTLTGDRAQLLGILMGAAAPAPGQMKGDPTVITRLLAHCVPFSQAFNLIEP